MGNPENILKKIFNQISTFGFFLLAIVNLSHSKIVHI